MAILQVGGFKNFFLVKFPLLLMYNFFFISSIATLPSFILSKRSSSMRTNRFKQAIVPERKKKLFYKTNQLHIQLHDNVFKVILLIVFDKGGFKCKYNLINHTIMKDK